MPLNLNDWGEILLKYYKQNPYSFYISLDNIVEGAREHDPSLVRNLTDGLQRIGSTITVDEYLYRLFARALGATDSRMTTSEIADVLRDKWMRGPIGSDLCVLALLICACETHTDNIRNANNYYDRLWPFLEKISFHVRNETQSNRTFMQRLRISDLAKSVNETCIDQDISLEFHIPTNNRGSRYTDAIMSQCLINGTIIERFKHIFGHSGFTPIVTPGDDEFLDAFRHHYSEIYIPENYANIMLSERETLLRAMHKAYNSWDGSTTYISRTSRNGTATTEAGTTIESLVLALFPELGSKNVKVQAFVYTEAKLESNLRHYTDDNNNEFNTQIFNGKSRTALRNDNDSVGSLVINSLNNGTSFELVDSGNDCKVVFRPKNFYLFRNCLGIWEEAIHPTIGQRYLLLVKEENITEVLTSLEESEAKYYDRIISPIDGYVVLVIENLKAIPINSRTGQPNTPRICIENFIYGGRDTKVLVLKDNCFMVSIDGLTEAVPQVKIVSTDNRKSYSLTFSNGMWVLDFSSIRFDCFDYDRTWNLYINTQRYLSYDFKIGKLQRPDEMRGMSLTLDGEISQEDGLCGLELSQEQLQHGQIVDATKMSIKASVSTLPPSSEKLIDSPADMLLYALAALSYDFFSLDEIETAAAIFAPQLLSNLENILNDWFALGYLNIGNSDSKRKFVSNQPTLVLLTPDYITTSVNGISASSISHLTCILSGGRDRDLVDKVTEMQRQSPSHFTLEFKEESDTLPHTILIHSKDIQVFSNIAENLGLRFNQRVYAPAMFAGLPTISQYREMARKHSVAYSGRALTYDINAIASDLQSGTMKSASVYKRYQRNQTGFNIYSDYGRKVGVMVLNDESYRVGRNWGLWIQAADSDCHLAIMNNANEFIIPGVTPLPRIYHRALCLITGQLPKYDSDTKTNHYRLVSNPTVPAQNITGDAIINKLQ